MGVMRRVRRTRVEQREETRRRLLDAAARIFARRGYEAASVEEIAEVAGFTRGAFYSNFRDKDELFVAFLEERMQAEAAEMAAAARAADDWPARFAVLRARYVRSHSKDTAVLYAELQLAAARHPDLRRKLRALFERHLETIARIHADVCGESIPTRFRPAFVALFAAVEGIALQKASGHADEETAEAALGMIFDAVAPTLAPDSERVPS
jgi:AcrR family transcriptional regulator